MSVTYSQMVQEKVTYTHKYKMIKKRLILGKSGRRAYSVWLFFVQNAYIRS